MVLRLFPLSRSVVRQLPGGHALYFPLSNFDQAGIWRHPRRISGRQPRRSEQINTSPSIRAVRFPWLQRVMLSGAGIRVNHSGPYSISDPGNTQYRPPIVVQPDNVSVLDSAGFRISWVDTDSQPVVAIFYDTMTRNVIQPRDMMIVMGVE
jgi:hypothetical protein